MCTRVVLNDVPIIAYKRVMTELPETLNGALFLFSMTDKLDMNLFENIILSSDSRNIEFYLDHSDNNVYITNYSQDQKLLDIPINAICFHISKVMIYIGSTCLVARIEQISKKCTSEEFYIALFEENNKEPSKKRRKIYQENRSTTSCMSNELGVFTVTSVSELSSSPNGSYDGDDSSSTNAHSLVHVDNSTNSQLLDDSYTLNPVSSIIETCLDQKELRKLYIGGFKKKLDDLIKQTHPNNPAVSFIPPIKLRLTKNIELSDQIVKKMSQEIEKHHVINDNDPILVTESNGAYDVISGSRRALAYKTMRVESVRVSTISIKDKERFELNKFLMTAKKTEPDTKKTISNIFRLLNYMELSPSTLLTWNGKELNSVFQEFLGKSTKLKFLFDICLQSTLVDAVKMLCDQGIHCSVNLCREVIRKYRQNPKTVLHIIQTTSSEAEIRKKLADVDTDLKFLLEQKKVDSITSEQLVMIYGDEDDFRTFVQGADFRFIDKKKPKLDIEKRYQIYKQKQNQTSATLPVMITASKDLVDCELLITSNEALKSTSLETKQDVLVLLFGQCSTGSNYALVVPDHLASKNPSGKLQNLLLMSIFMRKSGISLLENEISTELAHAGVTDKALLSLIDVRRLSKKYLRVFIDIGTILTEELSLEMVDNGCNVFVREEHTRRKMMQLLQKDLNIETTAPTSTKL